MGQAVAAAATSYVRSAFPGASDLQVSAMERDWEVIPCFQDQALGGIALMRGTEFHCIVLPHFKLKRKEMREFLRPLFERYGMLTTKLRHADRANERFNRAFGFKRTWSDSKYHYFMMTELPFGERSPHVGNRHH